MVQGSTLVGSLLIEDKEAMVNQYEAQVKGKNAELAEAKSGSEPTLLRTPQDSPGTCGDREPFTGFTWSTRGLVSNHGLVCRGQHAIYAVGHAGVL